MLGTELRTRRQRMGLTQETLAQKLGVHRTTVNRWEQGRLTIERPAMLRVMLEHLAGDLAAGRGRREPEL